MLPLTKGSRNAVKPVSPLAKAKTKETIAATINILTSKSSNCLRTSFQNGVPACLIKTKIRKTDTCGKKIHKEFYHDKLRHSQEEKLKKDQLFLQKKSSILDK